jgi:hypothetical protein
MALELGEYRYYRKNSNGQEIKVEVTGNCRHAFSGAEMILYDSQGTPLVLEEDEFVKQQTDEDGKPVPRYVMA